MYDAIPTILSPGELLDKALGRSAKIQKEDHVAIYRIKKTLEARVEATMDHVADTLEGYVKRFPNLERVDTYERELVDVIVGVGDLQRNLGRIEGSCEVVRRLGRESLSKMRRLKDKEELLRIHRGYVGRVSSIVDNLDEALAFLAMARERLQALPDVTPDDPTIVLAGYPNVGKSSLLARLSRARPEVAPYPYTTKQANVGHFPWPPEGGIRARRFQIVDTPGLLEKPPEKRNAIEKQAALALTYLADVVLFVIDPSETCGYTREQQGRLLESVRAEFTGLPVLIVQTKSDLPGAPAAPDVLHVSAITGDGIDALKGRLVEAVPEDPYEAVLGPSDEPVLRD